MKTRQYIIIVAILAVLVTLAGLFIYKAGITAQFNKQLELGKQYLKEENYQEAIAAFKKAMEIKPKRPEPYVNLAKIYISLNELEEAVKIISTGMKQSGDESIKDLLYEIKSELAASVGNFGAENTAQAVEFNDEAFERIIRKEFGKETGEIYDTDLIGIEWVVIYGSEEPKENLSEKNINKRGTMKKNSITGYGKIKTLDDLKLLPNIRQLMISDQYINDISSLNELSKLESLSLNGFQIADISSLQNLTNLTWLNLSDNQIAGTSPIKALLKLTTLDLNKNRISDIHALEGLVNLTDLCLSNNEITDISPLRHLSGLAILNLNNNKISDIVALDGLVNLMDLNLANNIITDIGALKELNNLTMLNLTDNKITDISPLKGASNLIYLTLSRNPVTDISPLKDLTNLTYLYLYQNQISDISALKGLTKLIDLNLADNKITDISALKDLSNLKYLVLSGNPLSKEQVEELRKALPGCKIEF